MPKVDPNATERGFDISFEKLTAQVEMGSPFKLGAEKSDKTRQQRMEEMKEDEARRLTKQTAAQTSEDVSVTEKPVTVRHYNPDALRVSTADPEYKYDVKILSKSEAEAAKIKMRRRIRLAMVVLAISAWQYGKYISRDTEWPPSSPVHQTVPSTW